MEFVLSLNDFETTTQTKDIVEQLEFWGIQPVLVDLIDIFKSKPFKSKSESHEIMNAWNELGPFRFDHIKVNEFLVVSKTQNSYNHN